MNNKIFKPQGSNNINMLHGNPKGLPDESFSKSRDIIVDKNIYKLSALIYYNLSPRCYPSGYAGFYILLGGYF